MKTMKQLIREFWVPFLLAVVWTAYNVLTSTQSWGLRTAINVFGPTFFLLSWATGQFFRVRKQSRVEDSFLSIEQRLKELLNTMDQRTQDLIGYATGADAMVDIHGYFHVTNPGVLMLSAMNQSKYPAHDIQGEWIDLDEPIDPSSGKLWTRHRFALPSLWSNRAIMGF